MSLAKAYKTLGGARVDLTAREMKRKSVLGASEFGSEMLDLFASASSDYAQDKSDLMAGEKLAQDHGYKVYDKTPGSNFNPKNWGGYEASSKKGNLVNPKERLRTLGSLGNSAEFVGKKPEKVVSAWESLNRFEDPNKSPIAKVKPKKRGGDDLGDDREQPSRGPDTSREDDYKTKIDWGKFIPKLGKINVNLPKIDWAKLNDFRKRAFPNWRETDTGIRETGSPPRDKGGYI